MRLRTNNLFKQHCASRLHKHEKASLYFEVQCTRHSQLHLFKQHCTTRVQIHDNASNTVRADSRLNMMHPVQPSKLSVHRTIHFDWTAVPDIASSISTSFFCAKRNVHYPYDRPRRHCLPIFLNISWPCRRARHAHALTYSAIRS